MAYPGKREGLNRYYASHCEKTDYNERKNYRPYSFFYIPSLFRGMLEIELGLLE
jgi:hypothetical protein